MNNLKEEKIRLKLLTKKEMRRIKEDKELQKFLAYNFNMEPDTWYQYGRDEKRKKLNVPTVIEKVREYIANHPIAQEA